MGIVTIFEKPDCTYCDQVHACLTRLIGDACAELKAEGLAEDPHIQIQRVNCSVDGALFVLCIRLTNSFTVPHVFFNEEYVGDASQFITLNKDCKEGCNLLLQKLKALALKPDPNPSFPPKPDAPMVKVTDELVRTKHGNIV
mmetsp:Transcript_13014/g.14919  ORF Transcript_13014/g.14919 Transcript_13014/m.14919 type:complete len:142 (-) Transcript_13014:390-815(-)